LKIIVIGASAGGIPALQELTRNLPADLDAAVFVVLHLGAGAESNLRRILQRGCAMSVEEAQDRGPIRAGHVYVARPDHHLVLEQEIVRLTCGPRENRTRPSIDVLFRSAAYEYGPRVVGVILSGALDDGTAGLWWIKNRGGTAIVQQPTDAGFASMPESALSQVKADYVVPVSEMAPLLARLVGTDDAPKVGTAPKMLDIENRIAKQENALQVGVTQLGPTTPYTCPECGGVLIQVNHGPVSQFRCHTGHAVSINGLCEEITVKVENSLWAAMRTLEESATLLSYVAKNIATIKPSSGDATRAVEQANEATKRADMIRTILYRQTR
jgi:two-component system chemotaxis response regulator CheB